MSEKRQKTKRFLAFLFPVQIFFFYFLCQNKEWIESVYIPYIFKSLTLLLRIALGWLPLSVGLLLVCFLFGYLIITSGFHFVRFFKKHKRLNFWETAVTPLAYLSILYGSYMLLWGLTYHRIPYQQTARLNTSNILPQDLAILCTRLATLTKNHRQQIPKIRNQPTDFKRLFKRASMGYDNMAQTAPEFSLTPPSLKLGFNKHFLSYLNIAGIYFPFTAEANLNENSPPFQAPFVICHEIAHQLGFSSEDEANYIAYLACMHHPDPEFRYAANHWLLFISLHTLKNTDEKLYQNIYERLDKQVIADKQFAESINQQYRTAIPKFTSNVLFDLFLKAQDQKAGINSYNLAVELMVGEYRKNGLQYE